MNYEVYELLHVSDDLSIFEFESIGPRGRILKRIQFIRTHLYGMAIGLNLPVLSLKYDIYAEVNDEIIPYVPNMNLDGFLVRKKN